MTSIWGSVSVAVTTGASAGMAGALYSGVHAGVDPTHKHRWRDLLRTRPSE